MAREQRSTEIAPDPADNVVAGIATSPAIPAPTRSDGEITWHDITAATEAQARATSTIERRRQRLLRLLLTEQPAARQTLADLAHSADWELPERIAVIAIEYREDQHRFPASELDRDVLADLESARPCLVVADPDPHLDVLRGELRGRTAAVGPLVPITEAHRSFTVARRALDLVRRGLLPACDITDCEQHLSTLLLHADEFLLDQLVEHALLPLAALTAEQRDVLSETLLAYMGSTGGVTEVAERLGVHPQTIRYRLDEAHDLFGPQLADPDERLMLELALRADRVVRA
ncbi:helix-turn-helix domain-containing protein [Haloechinothrix halophila]|uniref:helix-turn-helix domain-containing protein n=1 Tax=Haloechinothrix halophila TaxID=1069073 RepID=UPI0004259022|nr:PucR family transcriptional regulator [Haloechinothrix halophila]